MAVKWKDAMKHPIHRAARTRIYKVLDNGSTTDSYYLENKEGVAFRVACQDIEMIGKVDTEIDVTPTQMNEQLDKVSGFFHIGFVKQDGSLREMYAMAAKRAIGNVMVLRDLDHVNTTRRSCHMNRVYSLITENTQYRLKQDAFSKLLKR